MDGLAFQVSAAECTEANEPVPVTATTGLPVAAFVKKVTVPEEVPAVIGPKLIANACEPFTGIVTGNAVESTENPEPTTVALFTVNDWLPVL